ncbi:uncharacterized protein LOC135474902 [Liolophura sinensis]|uniref:uncharacterized protein LOC135474902 n=1 Tax=Liolophura sinensis TaxID=3198878 RepID=UPI00315896E0
MFSLCARVWLCNHGNMLWIQTFPVLTTSQQAISLSTSRALGAKVKMTRMLQKMMDKGNKRKWQGLTANIMANNQDTDGQRKSKITEGQRRRAVQVGKVLHDYVTSMMNSGELHPKLVECSVEVSKVEVVADFSALNVFWLASGTKTDVETQNLLDSNSGKLRTMLISFRAIGRVPKVNFVKDMSEARSKQVEEMLKIADMGPEEDRNEEDQVFTNSNVTMHHVTRSTQSRLKADFHRLSEFSNTQGIWLESGAAHLQNPPLGEVIISEGGDKGQNVDSILSDSNKKYSAENKPAEHLDEPTRYHPSPGTAHFRSDIYGLKREELVSKIIMLKRKAKDRSLNIVITDEGKTAGIPPIPTLLGSSKAHKAGKRVLKQKDFYTLVDAAKDDERWLQDICGDGDFENFEEMQEDSFSDKDDHK